MPKKQPVKDTTDSAPSRLRAVKRLITPRQSLTDEYVAQLEEAAKKAEAIAALKEKEFEIHKRIKKAQLRTQAASKGMGKRISPKTILVGVGVFVFVLLLAKGCGIW